MIVSVCILGWLFFALLGAVLGRERGRVNEGLLLGLLLGPIGILITLLLPARAVRGRNQGVKKCPYCGTEMNVKEMECPSCGRGQVPRPTNAAWERTLAAEDDVEKWAKKESKGEAS